LNLVSGDAPCWLTCKASMQAVYQIFNTSHMHLNEFSAFFLNKISSVSRTSAGKKMIWWNCIKYQFTSQVSNCFFHLKWLGLKGKGIWVKCRGWHSILYIILALVSCSW
jgi:hypothetical protein